MDPRLRTYALDYFEFSLNFVDLISVFRSLHLGNCYVQLSDQNVFKTLKTFNENYLAAVSDDRFMDHAKTHSRATALGKSIHLVKIRLVRLR